MERKTLTFQVQSDSMRSDVMVAEMLSKTLQEEFREVSKRGLERRSRGKLSGEEVRGSWKRSCWSLGRRLSGNPSAATPVPSIEPR